LLPADLARLRLNGRATDSQFAQNPIPVIQSMGHGLAEIHAGPTDGLVPRTPAEVDAAISTLNSGTPAPAPFTRSRTETLLSMLSEPPAAAGSPVRTHGAPVVSAAVLADSATTFEGDDSFGFDPPERDLAIVLRSLAETFAPEASMAFLDAYLESGGAVPDGPALDWYALVATFR
jgi:hypothetical protein